ncbi:hypothetical protein POM88_013343 [Heracleum sosnowskyi]|uniref:Branched-chain-amino-acid aminotransferase n=1 Tax=Heracleum sosnowskyi TaxID=360622 RepID=A0AAD8J1N4_9APIA|nr:hypothetical protein POM88_013343 [Heracleum sosnowskyi]
MDIEIYLCNCSNRVNLTKPLAQKFGSSLISTIYLEPLLKGLVHHPEFRDGCLQRGLLLKQPLPSSSRDRVDQFVEAVKDTVLANERWVPPPGKGSLYIRPLLMGSGSVLSLAPAPEFTFLIYVSPVGNYFKDGLSPIDLMVETETHRATPGGTGCVKTIGNYAAVLKAQSSAKAKGYSDVLYLDHSCAVFYLFHGAAGFKNHLD